MTTQTRIGLALAGIIVLIGAAALINGLGGEDDPQAPPATSATGAVSATSAAGASGPAGAPAPKPESKPDPGPLLKAGSVKVVKADKGETVRFRAVSKDGDELHVHGYDRTVELPAGETVNVKFKATLDGVFEIELHNTAEQIGELRVTP